MMTSSATGVTAIVPAAGRGVRVGAEQNKILLPLLGKPLLVWTLQALDCCPFLTDLVVAVQEAERHCVADLIQRQALQKSVTLVSGGAERQDSVRRALQIVSPDCPFVLVHDAARPLVTPDLCGRVVEAAALTGAAIVAVPCTDTVKVVDAHGRVERTLDRRALHLVQTPQVFRTDLLRQAHVAAQRDAFIGTDDAALVERLGHPVQVVLGSYDNIKITEARDFAIAENILKERVKGEGLRVEGWSSLEPLPRHPSPFMRIGIGYDLHRLAEGRPLIVGGIEVPFERGLVGHSDADVLVHALCDALLGAAGQPDIGRLFPDTDPAYQDADSLILLQRVMGRVRAAGYAIVNVDSVLIAERPKFAPHIPAMCRKLSEVLQIPLESINIKAKTSERLGFIGAGEGIAAYVVALLERSVESCKSS